MKRLARWTFKIAPAVSLVMFLITAILWLLALGPHQTGSDEIEFIWQRYYGIHSTEGAIFIDIIENYSKGSRYPKFGIGYDDRPVAGWFRFIMDKSGHSFGGFGLASGGFTAGPAFLEAMIPYWFLVAMFLVLPTFYVIGSRIRCRKIPAGWCMKCGYDLRATPDRCPECGAPANEAIESNPEAN